MIRKTEGWLFDLYPVEEGMALWIIARGSGERLMLVHPYKPYFFTSGPPGAVVRAMAPLRGLVEISQTERTEFYSGRSMRVTRVSVPPLLFHKAVRFLAGRCDLFTCDIPLAQLYLYDTGLFPLGLCEVEHDDEGRILSIFTTDSPLDIRYTLPPLRSMSLSLEEAPVNPSHIPEGWRKQRLEVAVDGSTYSLEPEDMVATLRHLILLHDPDAIFCRWGDSFLIHALGDLSARSGILIPFHRDHGADGLRGSIVARGARSYFTYGQIIFRAATHIFRGRWHLDSENSFFLGETGLEGLLELARLTRIPVQQLARASIGTGITSVQLEAAHRMGFLIPWRKHRPEEFKSALELLSTDKGGLTYVPPVGFFENVAELDFSSMYPGIMARYNISPETVGCRCCPESRVPEIGYTLCRRRKGLVPTVLEPLLAKRAEYKRLAKETKDPEEKALFTKRQAAIKWIMLACLDGKTLVPFRENGQRKLASMESIVERYFPHGEGTHEIKGDLTLYGLNSDLQFQENIANKIIKIPSPPVMRSIRLRKGRRLLLTPDHPCYVLQNGRLVIKRADQLKKGDFLPTIVQLPYTSQQGAPLNLIEELSRALPREEQAVWRIFGSSLKEIIAQRYGEFRALARGEYTDKSIWNWREYGYLPLQLYSIVKPFVRSFCDIFVGRGKRDGGIIQQLPAILNVDGNLGFFLGFFAGDGSAMKTFLRLDIGENEPDVAERLISIIHKTFGITGTLHKEKRARMFVLQVNSVAVCEVLQKVIRIGKTAENGKLDIPACILNGNKEAMYGFISGLVASDGSIDRKGNAIRIHSASKEFIAKLGLLLNFLGLDYRVTRSKNLSTLQICTRESLSTFLEKGWLKHSYKVQVEEMLRALDSKKDRVFQIPPEDTGLLWLAYQARKTRDPRVTQRTMISKTDARQKLEQIAQKTHRLNPEDQEHLKTLQRLFSSPLVFSEVLENTPSFPRTPYVYCFETRDALHGFFVEGGVFLHNCFGYLGFRNARFGRIEAHESVTATSRELLLQAKERAESKGFRMLHAIVDSLWLHKPGAREEDYQDLAREISRITGITLALEGIYKWINFLPSKMNPTVGVHNRFYGAFANGGIKVRGLEMRRHDAPPIIKEAQRKMIEVLAQADDREGFVKKYPEVLEVLSSYLQRIKEGKVRPMDLAIFRRLSVAPTEYRQSTHTAVVSKELLAHGIGLSIGEVIAYIIVNDRSPIKADRARAVSLLDQNFSYDVERYCELLLEAARSLRIDMVSEAQ